MADFRSTAMRRFVGAVAEMKSQIESLEEKISDAEDEEFRRVHPEDEVEAEDPPVEPDILNAAYELEMIEMMLGRMKNPE